MTGAGDDHEKFVTYWKRGSRRQLWTFASLRIAELSPQSDGQRPLRKRDIILIALAHL